MATTATYQIHTLDKIVRAVNESFVVPVNTVCLFELANSRRTAEEIISAVRKFDRSNSNRGDWETILHLILKDRSDVRTLIAQF